MKDPIDPLLKALAEDDAALATTAAAEARKRNRIRPRQMGALGLAAGLVGVAFALWFPRPADNPRAGHPPVLVHAPVQPPRAGPGPQGYVIVQTEEEARHEPVPLPSDASAEQKQLLQEAKGLPLLLVKNDAGKMVIHVIER